MRKGTAIELQIASMLLKLLFPNNSMCVLPSVPFKRDRISKRKCWSIDLVLLEENDFLGVNAVTRSTFPSWVWIYGGETASLTGKIGARTINIVGHCHIMII